MSKLVPKLKHATAIYIFFSMLRKLLGKPVEEEEESEKGKTVAGNDKKKSAWKPAQRYEEKETFPVYEFK